MPRPGSDSRSGQPSEGSAILRAGPAGTTSGHFPAAEHRATRDNPARLDDWYVPDVVVRTRWGWSNKVSEQAAASAGGPEVREPERTRSGREVGTHEADEEW